MFRSHDNKPVATSEQMHLHVDTQAGKASAAPAAIQSAIRTLLDAHRDLPRPAEAGTAMGTRR
jgi:acyl-CoA thioesterase FadM